MVNWSLVVCQEPLEICGIKDREIESIFYCIRANTSPSLQETLRQFVRHLQCDSELCLVRRWCKKGDFRTQAVRHFEYEHFMELYDAAQQCQELTPLAASQPTRVQGSIWKAFVNWIRFMIVSQN
ncbi:uncharacterized protein LOC115315983 [Ixodes scapularis]|uniref:uncharacterized protein LOC115315983 n=1 Tax=Ixodes scapularis TaxID=6945 RepID=UPI001A9F84E4|nr:uncharacterized protein LOC115315983 [Ixodes scapularis]